MVVSSIKRVPRVILTKHLDEDALEAIRTAEPSERSKSLDRLVDDSGTGYEGKG